MIIETRQFGHVEIPDEEIIYFPEGLYGFEEIKEYVLLGRVEDDNPFKWLQAVRNPDVCFVVVDPFVFKKDYSPTVNQKVLEKLEVEDVGDIRYLSIVVIPKEMARMTANLKSPLVINARKNIAMQVILDREEYQVRHYILEEVQKGA